VLNYRRERVEIKKESERSLDTTQTMVDVSKLTSWAKEYYQTLYRNRRSVSDAADLIDAISNGEQITFEENTQNDRLTGAISNLQDQLIKYRAGEERRTWAAEGLAQFSELLRENDSSLKDFGFKVISETVKYIGANQGGIFITGEEEGERYLEMIGCYAYERRKHLNKRIAVGEGLVGQCLQEKDTIYITEIPDSYIHITSGLGKAVPRHILIVPLIHNEEMYGAIEIASFTVLEDYKVDFLKELAESIAASLSIIQNNEKTQKLLDESRNLASELQSSEEEMRQNMEELTATQEEMVRKQLELDGVFVAIDRTMMKAEFDIHGRVLNVNNRFLNFSGWGQNEATNKKHQDFTNSEALHRQIWDVIMQKQSKKVQYDINTPSGRVLSLEATYSPVLNANNELSKVLLLGEDITDRKKQEQEHKRLSLVADNTDNSVIITDEDGRIEYVNKGFENMTGYTAEEVYGRKPGKFLQGPETNKETIDRISEKLANAESIYEEILNYDKHGNSYWISMVINPIFNDAGKLLNYISVQANITETKKTALDSKYKLEAIGKSNAVIEFDTTGIILDANENFLKIFDYELDEVLGHHHEIFVTDETRRSQEYKDFWKRLGKGEFVSDEFQRVDKHGEKIFLKGVYNPIFDINGNPHKIVKFAIDITEEKRLQYENKKNQVELHNHLDAINKTIASVAFDREGHILEANEIFLSVTRFTMSEIKGKSYFDLLPEKDRFKPQYQLMWESLKDGKFFSGEFKQVDKEGHEMWLTGTINPIYDINNNIKKVMLLAQFITKSKQKLNELTGSVTAMKGVMPVLELNKDFTLKNANPLFFEATGYKRLELRSLSFDDFLSADKNFKKDDVVKELEQGRRFDAQIDFTKSDGEVVNATVTFAGVQDLDLELDKIILLFTSMVQKGDNLKEANG
jgi:PAS domain S-box-containing protein